MSITKDFETLHRGEWKGVGYTEYAVDALLVHTRALEKVLKELEWSGWDEASGSECPECGRERGDGAGHYQGCKLGELIEGVE
jgi:hypothetical protein